MTLRYLSVCSGIEAATQAWRGLGWQPVAFSEIEKFPSAVLAHHYPMTPNWGDMTKFQEWPDADLDVLCGGTPCQSFSVAGLRQGLADPRGNLMLTFGAIAARYRPRWLCWENVPGVLSSEGGRDFASLLGLLTGQQIDVPEGGWCNSGIVPGIADAYGIAWRVLDAQYVRTRRSRRAVPQRRRRVFVVGYLGDWRRAAAVLFDAESLRRDPPPRREAGKGVAPTISARPTGGGGLGTDFDPDGGLICANSGEVGYCLTASAQQSLDAETETLVAVAHALRGEGFDASEDGTGRGVPLVAVAHPQPTAGALSANGGTAKKHGFGMGQQDWESGYAVPIAFDSKGSQVQTDEPGAAPTLRAMTHADSHQNGGGQLAVAYSIQAGALHENPEAGPDGVGVQEGHAYTLEARAEVQAVAFAENQRGEVRTSDVAMQLTTGGGKAGQGYPAVAFGITTAMTPKIGEDVSPTLMLPSDSGGGQVTAVAYEMRGCEGGAQLEGPHDTANLRAADGWSSRSYVAQPWAVRRLTPVECERLMDFPDGFTAIPWRKKPASACPDGPRYKALGNSWAVNVAEWVGERIAIVDAWPENETRAARPTNGDCHADQ